MVYWWSNSEAVHNVDGIPLGWLFHIWRVPSVIKVSQHAIGMFTRKGFLNRLLVGSTYKLFSAFNITITLFNDVDACSPRYCWCKINYITRYEKRLINCQMRLHVNSDVTPRNKIWTNSMSLHTDNDLKVRAPTK